MITDNKISQILTDMANSVAHEILLLLPSDKALVMLDKLGVIDHLVSSSRNGTIIKIII